MEIITIDSVLYKELI